MEDTPATGSPRRPDGGKAGLRPVSTDLPEDVGGDWPMYSPMPIGNEGFVAPSTPTLPAMDTMFPVMRRSPLRTAEGRRPGTGSTRKILTAPPTGRVATPQRLEVPTATQLVERFPQIDAPQRVEPPPWINAPRRRAAQSQDERAASSFDATNANAAKLKFGKYDIRSYDTAEDKPDKGARSPQKQQGPKRDNAARKKLKDRAMLATACKRADKGRLEAAAHFCMGVLHDNLDEFDAAIKAYQAFLAVCRRTADRVGEALAYNAIGVDFHLRGDRSKNPKNYQMAVHYHSKHLATADEQGQFVAHTNLGLAYNAQGRFDAAARTHQDALRIAIRLGSAFGQSIAVGNLGMVASRQGDLATAKACLDQHLALVQGMKDKNAESHVCQQLGELANAAGDYMGAAKYFEQSRRVAQMAGSKGLSKTAACKIGVAQGNLRMQSFMADKLRSVATSRATQRTAVATLSGLGGSTRSSSRGAGAGAGAGSR